MRLLMPATLCLHLQSRGALEGQRPPRGPDRRQKGEKEKAPRINRLLTGRGQKKRNDPVLRGWRTPLIFMFSAGALKNRDSGLFCARLKTFSFNLKESGDSPVSQMRCWRRQRMFYKVFVRKGEKNQGEKDRIANKKVAAAEFSVLI